MSPVPQLIDRERLPNAIALGSSWQAGRMIGPSITGILIAAFGGTVGFGLAAIASCTALALYSRLDVREEVKTSDGRRVLAQLAEGLSFVGHNFVFASLISLALFNALFGLSYITLLPVYADAYFGMGSTGYGLLSENANFAARHCISSSLRCIAVPGRGHAVRGGEHGAGADDVLTIAGHGAGLPMLALTGFCSTFYLTHVTTLIQTKVPDHLRGRVLSLYSPAGTCSRSAVYWPARGGRGRRALRRAGRRGARVRQRARPAHPRGACARSSDAKP